MPDLADLINPGLTQPGAVAPTLLVGTILDTSPLRVVVPALDGGKHALDAFGTLPAGAAEGDPVRCMLDEYGELVVVACQVAA